MKTIILLLLASSIMTSCSLFESLRPEEVFYCKVNDKTFRPRKDNAPIGGIGADPIRKYYSQKDSIFTIYVNSDTQFIGLNFKLKNLDKVDIGEYVLSNDIKGSLAIFNPDRSAYPGVLLYSESGIIKITKSEGFKIWGTFEFTCKNAKNGNEYKITKGQFNNPKN